MNPEFLPLPAGFKMTDYRRPKPLELKTFDEWSAAGFRILKGSKSVKRNDAGVCLFSSEQVVKVPEYTSEDEDDPSYEDDPDLPGNPADYGCSD